MNMIHLFIYLDLLWCLSVKFYYFPIEILHICIRFILRYYIFHVIVNNILKFIFLSVCASYVEMQLNFYFNNFAKTLINSKN